MKKFLSLCMILSVFGCKKNDTAIYYTGNKVPNWYDKLLIGTRPNGEKDTLTCRTVNGFNDILYNGTKLTWVIDAVDEGTEMPDRQTYKIRLFTSSTTVYGGIAVVHPSEYVEVNTGQWKKQKQRFQADFAPFNEVIDGLYEEQ